MESKIVVPDMGESVVEATVLKWFKKQGETVKVGEPLVELETDKVNLEVGATSNGLLMRIEKNEQADVHVGDVLGIIGDKVSGESQKQDNSPDETAAKPVMAAEKNGGERNKPETEEKSEASKPEPDQAEEGEAIRPPVSVPERVDNKLSEKKEEKITPVARRFAEENKIELDQLTQGSGAQGRITRQDLENLVQKDQPIIGEKSGLQSQVPSGKEKPPIQGDRREERVRMSRRRRTIAQNLVQAQQTAALLTTFNDVDMSAIVEIRKARKEAFKEKFGASLGFVSFFIKASILALKEFPNLNAEINGEEIILKRYYDIGVAIGAEEGLVVPVLRDADKMSFGEIEQAIDNFVQRTRDGHLTIDDLRGGTFTITNGGVFGSLLSTPIINAPQVGILGLHRIDDRPVAKNGQILIRQMMYLALTYDHRIVDGREAVQFLGRVKQAIENPDILLLES